MPWQQVFFQGWAPVKQVGMKEHFMILIKYTYVLNKWWERHWGNSHDSKSLKCHRGEWRRQNKPIAYSLTFNILKRKAALLRLNWYAIKLITLKCTIRCFNHRAVQAPSLSNCGTFPPLPAGLRCSLRCALRALPLAGIDLLSVAMCSVAKSCRTLRSHGL